MNALIYPMATLVLLSAAVVVILFRSRVRAVKAGAVDKKYFRIFQGGGEPEASAKAARHFSNLFEAPTLFYAGCLAAMVTHDANALVLWTAWVYVACRLVHAWVHLGSNRLRYRVRAYMLGWIALLALWVQVVVHVARQT